MIMSEKRELLARMIREEKQRLDEHIDDRMRHITSLERLLTEMSNRSPRMRGKTTSVRMTPKVAEEIRRLHVMYPRLPQRDLGNLVGVQQSRVSETLSGKRR